MEENKNALKWIPLTPSLNLPPYSRDEWEHPTCSALRLVPTVLR